MIYCVFVIFFFFFKQKTAYDMLRSLVGSEMCIRDSNKSYYIKRTCKYTIPEYPNPSSVHDALTQAEQLRKDGLKIRIDKW